MRLLLAGLLIMTSIARAEPVPQLPVLVDIYGVSEGSYLNIRSEPRLDAPVIGTFQPDDTGIEIVGWEPTARWLQVNVGERSGWVWRNYVGLSETTEPRLRCFGTEPFWSQTVTEDGVRWSTPAETADGRLIIANYPTEPDPRGLPRAFYGEYLGSGRVIRVLIQHGQCSDGMSDQSFALSATMTVTQYGQQGAPQSGCCSIAP
ncbi:putative membrane protein [Rubricella aquisinus]|uniref:Putative membrane protein n=1 Tax=Rubricella aquisinus TaxID=2028108 RepID=A0A840WH62_9RHOB|nr:SH3 domain-containing protein [Rubricella aquisinus]MBB5514458.1 putative membrane protein [Rubricella aquisinus]